MKTIMIIGAGEFQVPVIKKCKDLGYKVIVTDMNENAIGFKYADIPLAINTLDRKSTLEIAKKYKIDGILTTSDYPVRTVAYVCNKLNLNGLSENAACISTNKYLLRECLHNNNIICPKYWKIDCMEDFVKYKKDFWFPLIIKPVDSSASRGVIKIEKIEEVKEAYNEAVSYSKSGQVIVEEFIDGPEYSVESLTQNGKTHIIAITEKTTSGYPYFVEERHVIPARLKYNEEEQMKNIVKNCIKAIGLDNSSSHTELKLTKNGPIIIEIGARLGGDYITSDLVPLSTGVDMLANIINISIGRKIEVDIKRKKYSGIQFITPKNYYKVLKSEELIRKEKDIVKFEIKNNISNQLRSSLDRLGYYICVNDDRASLNSKLNQYI